MFIDSSKISLQSSLNILHELLTQLMARFAYLPKESWASCLSRAGRFYLRTKKADSGIVVGDICDYNNQAHSINEAASNMENDIINILNIYDKNIFVDNSDEEEEDLSELQNTKETLSDNIISSDSEDQLDAPTDPNIDKITYEAICFECSLNKKLIESLKQWRKKPLKEMIQIDISYNAYDIALNVIKDYYHCLDENEKEDIINNIFDEWLFNSNVHFPKYDMNLKDDFEVWKNLFKHEKIQKFSLIALRLIFIGTSESDVERLISLHRYIIHDRMSNISSDVLLASLHMRANAISENYL